MTNIRFKMGHLNIHLNLQGAIELNNPHFVNKRITKEMYFLKVTST